MLPDFKLAETLVQISDLEHCVWIPYGRTKIQKTLMIKTSNEKNVLIQTNTKPPS